MEKFWEKTFEKVIEQKHKRLLKKHSTEYVFFRTFRIFFGRATSSEKKSRHKISSVKKIVGKNFVTGKIIRHFLQQLKVLIEFKVE